MRKSNTANVVGHTLDMSKLTDEELERLALHGNTLAMRRAMLEQIKRRFFGVWTRQKPAAAGWWWYKECETNTPCVVFVEWLDGAACKVCSQAHTSPHVWAVGNPKPGWLDGHSGYWSAVPIVEPLMTVTVTNTTKEAGLEAKK